MLIYSLLPQTFTKGLVSVRHSCRSTGGKTWSLPLRKGNEKRKQVIVLTCDCIGEQMIGEYTEDHRNETQAGGGVG